MKKILRAIDKVVGFVFLEFGGLMTIGTFLLVLYTVLCRYVLHVNTDGIDELATYFVVCSVWAGAVLTSRAVDDGQIKIDFLRVIIKSEKANSVSKFSGS
jgi:TRAP-type C4-dicarboxylate transport system permease small subunit